ncbi:MAG: flagellar export protein FliJ [Clostridia bacterium]|jgi:flagellar FliJ protein
MKKFVFSLQTLLNLRESVEKEQKNKLQAIQTELHGMRQDLYRLQEQKQQAVTAYLQECEEGITTSRMKEYHAFFETMEKRIEEQKKAIKDTEKKEEQQKQLVIHAMKQRKILENLREKHCRQYLLEEQAKEQKRLDELAAQRAGHGMEVFS